MLRREVVNLLRRQVVSLNRREVVSLTVFSRLTSDLTLGTDLGICLNSREHETGTMNNVKYDYYYALPNNPNLDIRPRIEFTNYYKKFGLTIGYSLGLTNYENTGEWGAGNKAFSRMIRFGLAYRF